MEIGGEVRGNYADEVVKQGVVVQIHKVQVTIAGACDQGLAQARPIHLDDQA